MTHHLKAITFYYIGTWILNEIGLLILGCTTHLFKGALISEASIIVVSPLKNVWNYYLQIFKLNWKSWG